MHARAEAWSSGRYYIFISNCITITRHGSSPDDGFETSG
jgi:hypothetical protein